MDEPASTPEPEPLRVIDRLRRVRVSDASIQEHLARGAIRVDGEPVTDLEQPAPAPARLVIGPS